MDCAGVWDEGFWDSAGAERSVISCAALDVGERGSLEQCDAARINPEAMPKSSTEALWSMSVGGMHGWH